MRIHLWLMTNTKKFKDFTERIVRKCKYTFRFEPVTLSEIQHETKSLRTISWKIRVKVWKIRRLKQKPINNHIRNTYLCTYVGRERVLVQNMLHHHLRKVGKTS